MKHLKHYPPHEAAMRKLKHKQQQPLMTGKRLLIVLGDGSFAHNSRGHVTMPSSQRMFDGLTALGELVRWVDEHRSSKCCSSCGDEMEAAFIAKHACDSIATTNTINRMRRSDRVQKQALRRCGELGKIFVAAPVSLPRAQQQEEEVKSQTTTYYRRTAVLGSSDRLSRGSSSGGTGILKPWALRHCQTCDRLWDRDRNACPNLLARVRWLLSQPDIGRRLDGPAYLRRQPHSSSLSSQSIFDPAEA
jgi:hypothetical protein